MSIIVSVFIGLFIFLVILSFMPRRCPHCGSKDIEDGIGMGYNHDYCRACKRKI